MSYTYLQEQGEVSSAESFADIPQFALSRLNLIAGKSYCNGSETESCHDSQSGTMCKLLTANHGEDTLTSFAEDSRAKTFQRQEKVQELKDQDQVCGNTWHELSVKYDRNTHSWKTHRCLWEEDLQPSSLTLPKWGMMQNGVCWEQSMLVRHTDETESGFLLPTPRCHDAKKMSISEMNRKSPCLAAMVLYPTPTCADATMGAILNDNTKLITLKSGRLRKISNQGVSGSIGLARTVAMWPTPQAHKTTESGEIVNADGTPWNGISKPHSKTTGRPITTALADAVKMWPTPTCHNAKEQDSPSESTRNTPTLCHLARGGDETQPRQLNPTWVEWLMGWPLEWTDLRPLETDRFRQWLHLHGKL